MIAKEFSEIEETDLSAALANSSSVVMKAGCDWSRLCNVLVQLDIYFPFNCYENLKLSTREIKERSLNGPKDIFVNYQSYGQKDEIFSYVLKFNELHLSSWWS